MTNFSKIAILSAALLLSACGANETVLKDGKPDPSATPSAEQPTLKGVAADVEAMKTANFTNIMVVRRTDGGKFDADDRRALKDLTGGTMTPYRRVAADDETAFTLAANSAMPPVPFEKLSKRFAVEVIVSTPYAAANTNANAANSAKANTSPKK